MSPLAAKALKSRQLVGALLRSKPRSKFGVRMTAAGKLARSVDSILFASQKEAMRYVTLKLMARIGEIAELELQPRFPLHAVCPDGSKSKIGEYRSDFRYRVTATGARVVEDCKGMKTPEYLWKKKHAEAEYGISIKET